MKCIDLIADSLSLIVPGLWLRYWRSEPVVDNQVFLGPDVARHISHRVFRPSSTEEGPPSSLRLVTSRGTLGVARQQQKIPLGRTHASLPMLAKRKGLFAGCLLRAAFGPPKKGTSGLLSIFFFGGGKVKPHLFAYSVSPVAGRPPEALNTQATPDEQSKESSARRGCPTFPPAPTWLGWTQESVGLPSAPTPS